MVYFWRSTVKKDIEESGKREVLEISNDIANGITFLGQVILVKDTERIRVFSSRCTHLGCTITKQEGNELVCPCHGSRYNMLGKPVKGPSINNLEELDFSVDKDRRKIVITL